MGGEQRGKGANLLFGQNSPKNCMKMKKIGPRGGWGMHPKFDTLHIWSTFVWTEKFNNGLCIHFS